jgi:hypothetical protein
VLETNIHYPTDLNLLWDAARKSVEILSGLCEKVGISGWRKKAYWKRELKKTMRICSKASASGGANKSERLKVAAQCYLDAAYAVEEKVNASIDQLREHESRLSLLESMRLNHACYFHDHLIGHIDLVERRLIRGETIPHEEKVFSVFEEHSEMIIKGKTRPPVEFGHRLLIASEKNGLILDYKIMDGGDEAAEVLPQVDRLWSHYRETSIQSISYDKGFSSMENRELLEQYIPEVVMPKKGRKNNEDNQRESPLKWKRRRNAHSAVESDINCLEHHGLDRCPDKGFNGYKRYVGLGILAYNLHKIGRFILREEKAAQQRTLKRAA